MSLNQLLSCFKAFAYNFTFHARTVLKWPSAKYSKTFSPDWRLSLNEFDSGRSDLYITSAQCSESVAPHWALQKLLDLNPGPLVSGATGLPNVPQPLPKLLEHERKYLYHPLALVMGCGVVKRLVVWQCQAKWSFSTIFQPAGQTCLMDFRTRYLTWWC